MPKQKDGSVRKQNGPADQNPAEGQPVDGQRLDKWLWYARVVKSRTLATGLVQDGKVRVNRERIDKPSQTVKRGDVITLTVHRKIKVLKVLEPGVRRGPAKEASLLFEDLTPEPGPAAASGNGASSVESAPVSAHVSFEAGSGRPTKKDRRAIDRLKEQPD